MSIIIIIRPMKRINELLEAELMEYGGEMDILRNKKKCEHIRGTMLHLDRLLAKLMAADIIFELKVFCYGAMLMHTCFLFIAMNRSVYFSLWEIMAVFAYALIGKGISLKSFIFYYSCIWIEVFSHTVGMWLFWGDSCLMEEFIIFLGMLAGYIIYTDYSRRIKSIFIVTTFFVCAVSCFFIRHILPAFDSPWYFEKMSDISWALTAFNSIALFVLLFGFCFFQALRNREYIKKISADNVKLQAEAEIDHLTEIFNKRYAQRRLNEFYSEYLESGKSFSVAIGDIDFFKSINDTYGHEAGDFVLKSLGKTISKYIRGNDIASRWGGEEFLFVFDTDAEIAAGILERIRSYIEETPVVVRENKISVTITFGVGQIMKGETLSDFIHRVDNCLYVGKKAGRNQVVVSQRDAGSEKSVLIPEEGT